MTTYLVCVFVCFCMSGEQWWVNLQTCNDCGNDRISLWTSKGLSSFFFDQRGLGFLLPKIQLKKIMLYDLFIEILRRISIIIWLWMMSTNIKNSYPCLRIYSFWWLICNLTLIRTHLCQYYSDVEILLIRSIKFVKNLLILVCYFWIGCWYATSHP